MSIFQRVLFPIDLSLDYQPPTAMAQRMFDRRDVEIVMLHAIEEPSCSMRGTDVARSMAQMEFLARREFEFAQTLRRVERGRPADAILSYARNAATDAIVMPAGGPESLSRGSLGHVTEEVAMGAPCAVWVEWTRGLVEGARRICCAVTLERCDEDVLWRAAQAAEELGAELTIVHAVVEESPMVLWWDTDGLEQEVRMARMRVEELREKFAPAADVHVEAGRAERVVHQALRRLDAGLLVAAGHGEAILAAAGACPVLRIAARQPELARGSQRNYGGGLAATA